jgi:hypothetical protein
MTNTIQFKKVKNPNRIGNKKPKTPKQLEASRNSGLKVMLIKNPMKNPEILKKHTQNKVGRKRPDLTLRNILNNPSRIKPVWNKNKPASEIQKIKQSIKMTGRKIPNHHMKNPKSVKKNLEARKRIGKRKKIKMKDWIIIVRRFKKGDSITQLAKDYKMDRGNLGKLLKENPIQEEKQNE